MNIPTCHPERSKQSSELFAKSNHPLGWRPYGAGSKKFDRRYRKSFRRSRFAPSLWSGSTSKTFPRKVFSAQGDSERECGKSSIHPRYGRGPLLPFFSLNRSFMDRRVLAAARSRSGSDTTLWCHSGPSRRFATPVPTRF